MIDKSIKVSEEQYDKFITTFIPDYDYIYLKCGDNDIQKRFLPLFVNKVRHNISNKVSEFEPRVYAIREDHIANNYAKLFLLESLSKNSIEKFFTFAGIDKNIQKISKYNLDKVKYKKQNKYLNEIHNNIIY